MIKLSIHLLGPPEVRLDDQHIVIEHPTSRALLCYLASQGGMVEHQAIIPLFWEENLQKVGTQPLKDSIDDLRQILLEPGLILTSGDRSGLDFNRVYVDQRDFLDLIDQGSRSPWQVPPHQPLPERSAQLLITAAHLWRSPRFLDGADLPRVPAFIEWLAHSAQKMERLYSRIVGRLAEHSYVTGELDQALQFTQLALVQDKYNDHLHALYLRLLTKCGKSAEAIDYFQSLEDFLRRELDTSPSPSLIDLYRQLNKPQVSNGQLKHARDWNVWPSLQIPFVGRGQILAQMQQAYYEGGGVLIFGESGQGKTRLIQEFTALVDPQPRILLAHCHQAVSNLPFQPLIELFRHQVSPEVWLTLPAEWAKQILLIFPELAAMRMDLERPAFEADPKAPPGQTRALLFEAVRQFFLHISRDERLVFCLDDAQWSDEATLATIAYLMNQSPFDRKAILILAARSEQQNTHLEDLVASLQPCPRFHLIHLIRLDAEEVSQLAQSVIGYPPPENFTQQLVIDSGGNPLFILETLRVLSDHDIKKAGEGPVALPLPKSLQSLINTRLIQIAPAARRILEAAAILGASFEPEILAEVSQFPAAKVASTLDELERRLLIEPLTPDPRDLRYCFIHDKIREVLTEEIHPLHRRELHKRAAQLLEERLKGQVAEYAAILAQHYGLGGSLRKAFHYWVEAGRYARQLSSTAEAIQAFSSAQQLIRLVPNLAEEEIHGLYSEWTEMAYVNEDASTIQRINTELLHLGERFGSHLLIGTALDGLSDACLVANQFEEGLNYTKQAITHLEQTQILYEQMEAYNRRGVFLYMLNRIEEAIDSFQDALTLAVGSDEPRVIRARANAHFQIAIARTLNGWPKISIRHALFSLEDFRRVSQPHGQVAAYSALALARYYLGDYSKARKDCQTGIELAERLQAWRMLGYLGAYRAMIEAASGNIDAAFEHASMAIQLGERYGHNEITAIGHSVLGDLYSWLDSHDRAIESYRCGIEASKNGFLAVNLTFRLGHSLCRTGSIEEGLKLQQQSLQIAESSGLGLILIFTQLSKVIVDQILGEWDRVKTGGDQLLEKTFQRSIQSIQVYTSIALGKAALHEEDLETALEYFRSAISRCARLPFPWAEIESLRQVEKVLRLAGGQALEPHERILALLDQIESSVTSEPLRQIFLDYRSKVSKIE